MRKKMIRVLNGTKNTANQAFLSNLSISNIEMIKGTCILQAQNESYSSKDVIFLWQKKSFLQNIINNVKIAITSIFSFDIFHFHSLSSLFGMLDLVIIRLMMNKILLEFHGDDIRFKLKIPDKSHYYLKVYGLKKYTKQPFSVKFRSYFYLLMGLMFSNYFILHDNELVDYFPNIFKKKIIFMPLRVDTKRLSFDIKTGREKNSIQILHAPSNKMVKGTDKIREIVGSLKKEFPNLVYLEISGVSNSEVLLKIAESDIIIDQIYGGTYGVLSIESMALGKTTLCYINDMYMNGYPAELPIVSVDEETLYGELSKLLVDTNQRTTLGLAGKKYVSDYHDVGKTGKYLAKIYENPQLFTIESVNCLNAFMNVRDSSHEKD